MFTTYIPYIDCVKVNSMISIPVITKHMKKLTSLQKKLTSTIEKLKFVITLFKVEACDCYVFNLLG